MNDEMLENSKEFEEEAKRILEEKEFQANVQSEVKGLGKAKSFMEEKQSTVIEEIGWIRIKPETLPSKRLKH